MRTIEQAEKDCRAAWAAQPEATQGWCIHHEKEWEKLSEPIENRIAYIRSYKRKIEQVTRLNNMRPMSAASAAIVATAWAEYQKVTATALEEYQKGTAPALEEYKKAIATAHRADVPTHTWKGKSIF